MVFRVVRVVALLGAGVVTACGSDPAAPTSDPVLQSQVTVSAQAGTTPERVSLLVTNNSPVAIYYCGAVVEARRGADWAPTAVAACAGSTRVGPGRAQQSEWPLTGARGNEAASVPADGTGRARVRVSTWDGRDGTSAAQQREAEIIVPVQGP